MAGILVRIIGMLYRMPLNDIIGKAGKWILYIMRIMYTTFF